MAVAPHGPRGGAHVQSDLTTALAQFDPLQTLIERAHRAGIEVHPWITVVRREDTRHPEFFDAGTPDGAYDVHRREFREFMAALAEELASRYDIDGVNLDYIRTMGICRSESCARDFARETGRDLIADIAASKVAGPARDAIERWQDTAVRELVTSISGRVRAARPGARMTVSGHPVPTGTLRALEGRAEVDWLRRGLIDAVFAMEYDAVPRHETIAAVAAETRPGAARVVVRELRSARWRRRGAACRRSCPVHPLRARANSRRGYRGPYPRDAQRRAERRAGERSVPATRTTQLAHDGNRTMNALPWIAAALIGSTTLFLIWRGTLVFVLLLIGTLFLGWVRPESLEIAGAFDVHAAIMIFVAIATAFGLTTGLVRTTTFGKPVMVLGGLWLIGLLMPVLRGDSTLWLALNASKEFMTLFAYVATVQFLRSQRDLRLAWRIILLFGVYYSLVEIAAQILGPALITKMAVDHRLDAFGLWKVYLRFWPVIVIALLYGVFAYCQGRRAALPLLLLTLAGTLLTFFRSYLLAILAVVPCLLIAVRAARESRRAVIELAVVFGFAVAIGALLAGHALSDASDSFMFSGLRELRDQSGGALAGRRAYAEMLFELASQRPLFGFGFIERDSEIAQHLSLGAGSLGFIDAGWADVLVKFGYLGGATLLLTWLWIFKRALNLARRTNSVEVRLRALTVSALILVYIIVLPVHAPLTHSFGLLPLALALGILDGEQRLSS